MSKDLVYLFCIVAMLAATVVSFARWKIENTADRIIALLLIVSLVSELTAYVFMITIQNNMYVYHVFSPIELALVALYYDRIVPFLHKLKVGFVIAVISIMFGIVNARYLQPPASFPSVFMIFEGFIIILLSLLSFFSIFYRDDYKLKNNAQFLITFNLLIFWTFTFLIWGTYVSFSNGLEGKLPVIFNMLTAINLVHYLNYFLIFLFYRQLLRSGE